MDEKSDSDSSYFVSKPTAGGSLCELIHVVS